MVLPTGAFTSLPRAAPAASFWPGRFLVIDSTTGYLKWPYLKEIGHTNVFQWRSVFRYVYQIGYSPDKVKKKLMDAHNYDKWSRMIHHSNTFKTVDTPDATGYDPIHTSQSDWEWENQEFEVEARDIPGRNQLLIDGRGSHGKSIFFNYDFQPGDDGPDSTRLFQLGGYFHTPGTCPPGWMRWPIIWPRMRLAWAYQMESVIKDLDTELAKCHGAPTHKLEHMTDYHALQVEKHQIPAIEDIERKLA